MERAIREGGVGSSVLVVTVTDEGSRYSEKADDATGPGLTLQTRNARPVEDVESSRLNA